MADPSITPSAVVPPTTNVVPGIAGEAILAGQSVYSDSTDSNKIKLADCNASAATATAVGLAANSAPAAGQPVSYLTDGDMTMNAVLVQGEIYLVSATAGGISPEADIVTTDDYVSIIGVAKSTTVLSIKINNSGNQIP